MVKKMVMVDRLSIVFDFVGIKFLLLVICTYTVLGGLKWYKSRVNVLARERVSNQEADRLQFACRTLKRKPFGYLLVRYVVVAAVLER
jgi:uncharacterized membrane protein